MAARPRIGSRPAQELVQSSARSRNLYYITLLVVFDWVDAQNGEAETHSLLMCVPLKPFIAQGERPRELSGSAGPLMGSWAAGSRRDGGAEGLVRHCHRGCGVAAGRDSPAPGLVHRPGGGGSTSGGGLLGGP